MKEIEVLYGELVQFSSSVLELHLGIGAAETLKFERSQYLTLPEDYKAFLEKTNGFSLMGEQVLGVDFSTRYSIVSAYDIEHFKVESPQPSYLVPFSNDGRGNFYCFDTRIHEHHSCPVVYWQSGYPYSSSDLPEVTHRTFIEWVKEVIIEWTLDDYDYAGNER
jgi:hypothetical protein